MATMQDPAFVADVKRSRLEINPLPGDALEAEVARLAKIPPALIARARRLAN
jgi:hypothetical protein